MSHQNRIDTFPVRHGARKRAFDLTQRAAEASLRLHDDEDVEALHDFRVAVRRLRTFLRAYDHYLDTGRKLRRRLRRLTRLTNEPRDLEVGLGWLRDQRGSLHSRHRFGLDWLIRKTEIRKIAAYESVRSALPTHWSGVEQRLRKRLAGSFSDDVTSGTFGTASARLIDTARERLDRALDEVRTLEDITPAHDARILAKHLRYLAEPFRGVVPSARPLVQQLRELQDMFGAMNDAHIMLDRLRRATAESAEHRAETVFALSLEGDDAARPARAARSRSEQPGLIETARIAQRQRVELFERIRETYLDGAAEPLLARIEQLVRELSPEDKPPIALVASEPAGPGPRH